MGVRPWVSGPVLLTRAFINLLEVPGVPDGHGGGWTRVAGGGAGRGGLGEELGPVQRGGSQKASDSERGLGRAGLGRGPGRGRRALPLGRPGLGGEAPGDGRGRSAGQGAARASEGTGAWGKRGGGRTCRATTHRHSFWGALAGLGPVEAGGLVKRALARGGQGLRARRRGSGLPFPCRWDSRGLWREGEVIWGQV